MPFDSELDSILMGLDEDNPSHIRFAARFDREALMEIARAPKASLTARLVAVKALALNPDARVITLLRQLAHDEDIDLWVIETLNEINTSHATQALLSLLKLPRAHARAKVVGLLAARSDTRHRAQETAARDPAAEVIARFLSNDCRPGEGAVGMLNLLSYPHDQVREAFLIWLRRGILERNVHRSELPQIKDALQKAVRTERVRAIREGIRKTLDLLSRV